MKRSKYSQLLLFLLMVPGGMSFASSHGASESNGFSMLQQSVTTKGTVVGIFSKCP